MGPPCGSHNTLLLLLSGVSTVSEAEHGKIENGFFGCPSDSRTPRVFSRRPGYMGIQDVLQHTGEF